MINKFFKIVHTKYLKLFRFVFFIRYLLVIFIISFALFLIIPIFFDYEKRIEVISTVKSEQKTGVEMEALTAVSVAALTIYDMVKGVDKSVLIEKIGLTEPRMPRYPWDLTDSDFVIE